jgi:hypothetical protein
MRVSSSIIVVLAVGIATACKQETTPPSPKISPPPSVTASPEHVPAGVTAVQNEMRLLHEAMRNCVTAVAYGTLDSIPEDLHAVHRARELTEKALESGEYKLRKNPERLASFKELDDQFHGELENLVAAARSKDGTATGRQVGVVLSKCSGCHAQFKP